MNAYRLSLCSGFACFIMTSTSIAQGQYTWNHDVAWIDQGWWLGGEGFWQQPVGLTQWQNALAIASEAFDSDGNSEPMVWRVEADGQTSALPMPSFDSLEIELKHIRDDAAGNLWALANGIGMDLGENKGLSSEWMQLKWSENVGSEPEVTWLSFGSPFQSVLGWAEPTTTSNSAGLAVGYVLDPCCFHKEMPALALMDESGGTQSGFGTGGALIVDLSDSSVSDTLGIDNGLNRHEVGGYYNCAAAGPNGSWYAAGAYSNAYHYELLLAKHLANGELDPEFGTEGWVHLNLSPGQNHSAKSIAVQEGTIAVILEHETTDELAAGWNQITFDFNGAALSMQTLEFDESWSSNGLLYLPNADVVGIGTNPNEGMQGTYLIDVFSNDLSNIQLTTDEAWDSQWLHALGVYHEGWERLVAVGQWEHGASDRPLLATRWSASISQTVFESSAVSQNISMPFPNPAVAGGLLNVPDIAQASGNHHWSLVDQTGRVIALEWLKSSKQICLPATLSPGHYFLVHASRTRHCQLMIH